jgi:hypothetical protein
MSSGGISAIFRAINNCRGHRLAPIVSPLSFPFYLILIRFPSYLRYPYSVHFRSLVLMVPFRLLTYRLLLHLRLCALPSAQPDPSLSFLYSARLISIVMPETITYSSCCLAQLPCFYSSARLIMAFDSIRLSVYCRVYKTSHSHCISSV